MSEYNIARLYNPVKSCGESTCDVHFYEFIYCVVVPGTVVLLLALILASIMCCKSNACKCKKKNTTQSQADEIQMENYNSIRRASAGLRQMSHNRETPIMGSRAGSMTLDRPNRRGNRYRDSCQSAPGTLQRQHRGRHYEQLNTGSYFPYANDNEELLMHQSRHSQLTDVDVPCTPPPPPAYSRHSDVFSGADFLPSNVRASVRYDDSPGQDEGKQLLL
ncbi:epsilon-sarcoglycan [Biomphalaria glabrata]